MRRPDRLAERPSPRPAEGTAARAPRAGPHPPSLGPPVNAGEGVAQRRRVPRVACPPVRTALDIRTGRRRPVAPGVIVPASSLQVLDEHPPIGECATLFMSRPITEWVSSTS